MDFITLVKTLRRECRVTGTNDTVTSPTESSEWQNLIEWVAQAWIEIQILHHNWKWMRTTASFTTTVSKGDYSLSDLSITDHAEWLNKTGRIYLTASGTPDEQYLDFMEYENFRDMYLFGTTRTQDSRPTVYTIDPTDGIIMWPRPSDNYTVSIDYQKKPTALALDADTPDMPERFHYLIVYDAMKKYAFSKAAQEVYDRGELSGKPIRRALRLDQLPRKARGKSLI